MTTPPTLNGLRAVAVRLLTPWRGVWIADVDLDPELVATAPKSGPAALILAGVTMLGTIDPRGSGSFVSSARVRVVGGAGGWDDAVGSQHWQSDVGVTSTAIFAATASLVGEKVVDLAPEAFTSFVRPAGAASVVFRDRDWWVDFLGVTNVGTRAPSVADGSLELLEWEPLEQRATVACDALIVPGTSLTDKRLNGSTVVVRDVEQVFSKEGGARATLWCSDAPVNRLMSALTNIARRVVGAPFLKVYRYRIVLQGGDGRLQLQAVQPAAGMPDTLPLNVWTGMQGVTATVDLSQSPEVLVEFVDGDPSQPIVRGFRATDVPLTLKLDASVQVQLAGGMTPVALSTFVDLFIKACVTAASGPPPGPAAAAALAAAVVAFGAPGSPWMLGGETTGAAKVVAT